MGSESIDEILTQISKEKFRRRMLISTRVIAVGLIIAIIWIGFVQIKYVKDVNTIRGRYGSLGYCYMCGLETLRKCECQYRPEGNINITEISKQTALGNVASCELFKDTVGNDSFSLPLYNDAK